MPSHRGFETQREEHSAVDLEVEGSIPGWLRGRYVQNGPGQFEVGGETLTHWFDPLAMLRSVHFAPAGPTYTNRFVRSQDLEYAREHGRVRTPFPGTPPDRSVLTRVQQVLSGTTPDNPVIGIARVGDELAAVTESATAIHIDPETLSTVGHTDLTAGLEASLTLGHPHYDPETGGLVNLAVEYGRDPRLTLFRRDSEGVVETTATVTPGDAPYVHSFALTERYAVVPATPFGIAPTRLLAGLIRGSTFLDAITRFDRPARFIIVDRTTGEVVAEPRAEPFFVYHHANAYERGDELVVDCIAYPDERAVTALTVEGLRSETTDLPRGDLVRFVLPLEGGRARRRLLLAGPLEFPTVNYPAYAGRAYRYVYAVETEAGVLPTAIRKVDLDEDEAGTWRPEGHPGEPLFVPAPDAAAEDDGVVLSVVVDARGGPAALVVLDAATLTERARLPLPQRLPYGFHGQFYHADDPTRHVA